jgi:thiol-disulfide isomerase/thioredoxin
MRPSRPQQRLHRSRLAFLVSLFAASLLCKSLPAQTVVDLNGSADEVVSASRGKVLVLVFVRTDCPISNRYAPVIQELQQQFPDVKYRLVFPDKTESATRIREYLREYHHDLTAVRDIHHTLVKMTQAKITPEAAVFGPDGRLVYHGRIDNSYQHLGQPWRNPTTHELADAISAAQAGKSPAVATADAVGCFIADLE